MGDTSQELDQRIEEALSCPCVDDIRDGPCGKQFKEAFRCYVKNFQSDEVSLIFCPSLVVTLMSTQCTVSLLDFLRAERIKFLSALSSLRSCSEGQDSWWVLCWPCQCIRAHTLTWEVFQHDNSLFCAIVGKTRDKLVTFALKTSLIPFSSSSHSSLPEWRELGVDL